MNKKQYSKSSTASGSSSPSTTNKRRKLSSSTASSVSTTTMGRSAVLPQPARRIIQNFLLVWLDAAFDESKENYKTSIQHLRDIVATITIFTDADQCVDFLSDIQDEKVFMIVSGALAQYIVPEIQALPQLYSVYVFCDNPSVYEHWIKIIPKVKGVYTQIEPICEALQIDCKNCDRSMISFSFNRIDPLFMYTQLLKETFLEIDDDDDKAVKEFVDYCRLQGDINANHLDKIEQEYRLHTPIWWYTGPFFMYSMLNRGLRQMDVEIILKMGFFIRHLHQHIENLRREQESTNTTTNTPFQVFRGQNLSLENFEKMKKTKGGLMSFNNFLSTSRNRNVSLELYARPADHNSVGILFDMTIDPTLCATPLSPFIDVKNVGFFEDEEEEILFTTHTVFRIDGIQPIDEDNTDRRWEVKLTLVSNDDHELNTLTKHIRQELGCTTAWSRLGDILIKLGESPKAEQLYQILLQKASSDKERSEYNLQLGSVYDNMGEYSKALSSYERSLEIQKIAFSPNHPSLASTYHNIGTVYYNMGEYSKARSLLERSLEIQKIALPPNHLDFANFYNNIGMVYYNMGEYSKALSSVYQDMGENSKALKYYEKNLQFKQKTLPPNHPDLASTYNQIGLVYYNMGEYSKALSSYERALEICKIALPPNHPNLAASYNNIGMVYYNMGEYSKALSSYEQSLEIKKIALPSNHPDLADSYNNIGYLYNKMGDYSKALSSHERSLEIRKVALPMNHPVLAYSYDNIGLVYKNLLENTKALVFCQKALDIRQTSLTADHPDLATSYNSNGLVYESIGKYSKALSFYQKALEIRERVLPTTHPDITESKTNIENVKKKL
ncbi:unnamed protein product [Rotaria sordida]|uniref:UDP-N-acetylglucosamine--peptide N-acetylglucosaminyltransferase SPINDLY n=1 Tax=Rotaria sordida TaxID=392033 RepID=A0A815STW6_9BILA|nr:unnamed protein product [Rotaria sordida]